MLELGLMRSCGNGTFYILPMLQRALDKSVKILDNLLHEIDCQKLTLPILTSAELWKKSGRFETAKTELILAKDRHDKMQILGPVRFYHIIIN